MTLRDDINTLQHAALSVEDQLRKSGYYSADCKSQSLDAAIARKKTGVALLFDQNGEMEVVDLNGGAEHIEVSKEGQHVTVSHGFEGWHNPTKEPKETQPIESTPAYTQVNEHSFKGMAEKSHERANAAKGQFSPQSHEGPRSLAKAPTADAARMAAELKAKQTRDAAREKAFNTAQYERNARIAEQMKEASNKQWAGRR